jgi:hypothetical protein
MDTTEIIGEKCFTPNDLAKAKILSRSKQYELRKAGRLRFLVVDSKIMYPERFIKEFLASCERGGSAETEA